MRRTSRSLALLTAAACTALTFGCTRPTPAVSSAAQDNTTARSVFTDTTVYRRFCEVSAGRPVSLEKPCVLLDQSRSVDQRVPPPWR